MDLGIICSDITEANTIIANTKYFRCDRLVIGLNDRESIEITVEGYKKLLETVDNLTNKVNELELNILYAPGGETMHQLEQDFYEKAKKIDS